MKTYPTEQFKLFAEQPNDHTGYLVAKNSKFSSEINPQPLQQDDFSNEISTLDN